MNPLETMMRPCPEDICDGTGMVLDEERGEVACLCMADPFAVEPDEKDV